MKALTPYDREWIRQHWLNPRLGFRVKLRLLLDHDMLSERQARLMSIAMTRIWVKEDNLTITPAEVKCLEIAEAYATAAISYQTLEDHWNHLRPIRNGFDYCLNPDPFRGLDDWGFVAEEIGMTNHLTHILYEIYGYPLRKGFLLSDWVKWLEANNNLVGRLSNRIYNEKDFAALPILADALEDAGCRHEEILNHLHNPGPHFLGCWALDEIVIWFPERE